MPLSSYIATDDLTVLLGLSAAALFLLQNLYKPQPLVHPILLGRQSDVAPVRNPSESAVYRNYSTSAMGRVRITASRFSHLLTAEPQLPLRPTAGIQTIIDLVRVDVDSPRTLWSTRVSHILCVINVEYSASGPFLDYKCSAARTSKSFCLRSRQAYQVPSRGAKSTFFTQ